MDEDQLETFVSRFLRATPGSGSVEEDLLEFGKAVLEESTRLASIVKAREICLSGGGHFFSFPRGKEPNGDISIENGKTIISGWRGCDITCDNCDAWLTIKWGEKL